MPNPSEPAPQDRPGASPPRLVAAELALLDAALEGDDALSLALGGHAVAENWHADAREAIQWTRDRVAEDPEYLRWGTRLFVAEGDPPALIGWGGFKGAPADGVVELGYAIAPAERGRGLATAAVEAMLREAFADPAVTAVIAHTLPEANASTRVLEKSGFRRDGEGRDEDVGTVWRWRRERG
ncbi:MAG TPA: GNAT family N-acetyltransferase [Thermoleophilaceae bacterium]|jgi:RimJ/RimL family protein N-acetyltransferase